MKRKLKVFIKEKRIWNFLKWFSIYIILIIGFFVIWFHRTWPNLSMDQLSYQLNVTAEGTPMELVMSGVVSSLIPPLVIVVVLIVIDKYCRKFNGKIFYLVALLCSIGISVVLCGLKINQLELFDYIDSKRNPSTFIEENYVDPRNVSIVDPEKKQNLIYIYLESIETTYVDEAHGGAFSENVIPELTDLANIYDDFSKDELSINGAYSLWGTSYTMGGIFAQSTGLPLVSQVNSNLYGGQQQFFPEIVSLGDILNFKGYNNVFMCGSDSRFAAKSVYFLTHGYSKVFDYYTAIAEGKISNDYYAFWGFEDVKLLEYAKTELIDLASSDQPFCLTIQTVDTHFEDGYICNECGDYFDIRYSNTMRCSSKQVYEFVEWIQQQDFAENTTIVMCGDHLTMDADYCEDVPEDYNRRVYTCIINSKKKPVITEDRIYSTFDLFPTTIEALGFEIEGAKLGLGVSLYSEEQTLLEKYDIETLNKEMAKGGDFVKKFEVIDYTEIIKGVNVSIMEDNYNNDGNIRIKLDNELNNIPISEVIICPYKANGEFLKEIICDYDGAWEYTFTIPQKDNPIGFHLYVKVNNQDTLYRISYAYGVLEGESIKIYYTWENNDFF